MKKNIVKLIIKMLIPLLATSVFAGKNVQGNSYGSYTQAIQVVNLLANTNITDPGMTPTPIIIKYFNGGQNPCWITTLNYQEDATIHAGPTQGCVNKVSELIISTVLIADKLRTYQSAIVVPIDITKYSSQITVMQDDAPEFNSQNGLVTKPGTVKVNTQTQFFE